MHRQSSRPARGTLTGLAAAAIALASACTPNNNVKPGAPVLTEVVIIENGSTGTTIPVGTTDCGATVADGNACDPNMDSTMDVPCRLPSSNTWCRCGANAMWNCQPFSPISTVLFVFDRLLDSAPFDPGDAGGGVPGIATTAFMPASPSAISTSTDYVSNGSPKEVIFPLFGDLRTDGPNLLVTPSPTLPAAPGGSTITVGLDKTKVLAKDGKTSFVAAAPFADGSITFMVPAFGAAFTAMPTPPTDDAGTMGTTVPPDMTPVVATFNNLVDATAIPAHITASAMPVGGSAAAAVAVDITSMDGLSYSIVPTAGWPASSVVTVTVDATAADLAGDTIGAPGASTSFTTSAM